MEELEFEDAIEIMPSVKVKKNEDTIEPNEYFTVLKSNSQTITPETIEAQLMYSAQEIIRAKSMGQDVMVKKLEFTMKCLVRERALYQNGLTKFVNKDAVAKHIDNLKPKNSVKLIELSRYQRMIPADPAKEIARIRDKGLFDDFIVLFTDLTDNTYKSKDEEKFLARNRDPICFGYFRDQSSGDPYNRLYLVADWEDEFCNLTWEGLVSQIQPEDVGEIDLNVIDNAMVPVVEYPKLSWWSKIIGSLKIGSSK